jgi:hypothetical protein
MIFFYSLQRIRFLSALSDARHVSCLKHFLSPEMLPACVLLSFSVLSCQDTHCSVLHEQLHMILIPSIFREWTHVSLVNSLFAPAQFCATYVSNALAIRVIFTQVSRGEVGRVYYKEVHMLLIPFLCYSTWLFLGWFLNDALCMWL